MTALEWPPRTTPQRKRLASQILWLLREGPIEEGNAATELHGRLRARGGEVTRSALINTLEDMSGERYQMIERETKGRQTLRLALTPRLKLQPELLAELIPADPFPPVPASATATTATSAGPASNEKPADAPPAPEKEKEEPAAADRERAAPRKRPSTKAMREGNPDFQFPEGILWSRQALMAKVLWTIALDGPFTGNATKALREALQERNVRLDAPTLRNMIIDLASERFGHMVHRVKGAAFMRHIELTVEPDKLPPNPFLADESEASTVQPDAAVAGERSGPGSVEDALELFKGTTSSNGSGSVISIPGLEDFEPTPMVDILPGARRGERLAMALSQIALAAMEEDPDLTVQLKQQVVDLQLQLEEAKAQNHQLTLVCLELNQIIAHLGLVKTTPVE